MKLFILIIAIHKSELVNAWCLPFMGSDRPVVLRSQRFLYEHEKKRPIQIQTYVQFKYDDKQKTAIS